MCLAMSGHKKERAASSGSLRGCQAMFRAVIGTAGGQIAIRSQFQTGRPRR